MTSGRTSKQRAIMRDKRIRNVGTKVPPPFPNGWFKIIDTEELKAGTAHSVNMLGIYLGKNNVKQNFSLQGFFV